jgi:amino acid adenylation domain-containing protein
VALIGTLKARAVAVLAAADTPAGRLAHMVADVGSPVLVVSDAAPPEACLGGLAVNCADAPEHVAPPCAGPDPEDDAYIVYTSGSTGRPKGVVVSHDSIANSTLARRHFYSDSLEAFLLLSPMAFDSALAGIFWTLADAATLLVPEELDTRALAQCDGGRITALCTPSFYSLFLQDVESERFDPGSFPARVIVAGEGCPGALVARHMALAPGVPLYNEYGPSEACVWSTAVELTRLVETVDPVPIGLPIANTSIVLRGDNGVVRRGNVGEICIAGRGLARGYLGDQDLTSERFIRHPLDPSARLYRTGDRGRLRSDGQLEFLGRFDDQVKVRGCRVEPSEVEAVLLQHCSIANVGVAAVGLLDGRSLLALVVARRGGIDAADVRAYAGRHLPSFMVPDRVVEVAALPMTAAGKLDRAALGALVEVADQGGAKRATDAGASELQDRILELWRRVLGVDGISVDDDFFELGGNSLAAVRLLSAVRKTFNVKLSLRAFFDGPTVREVAVAVERGAPIRV